MAEKVLGKRGREIDPKYARLQEKRAHAREHARQQDYEITADDETCAMNLLVAERADALHPPYARVAEILKNRVLCIRQHSTLMPKNPYRMPFQKEFLTEWLRKVNDKVCYGYFSIHNVRAHVTDYEEETLEGSPAAE